MVLLGHWTFIANEAGCNAYSIFEANLYDSLLIESQDDEAEKNPGVKMSFTNQFSLSLELTKLIPLTLAVAGRTYEAAMSLARDLQVKTAPVLFLA